MSLKTYDFAILGDSQPEGLLAASALARKGFSVLLIPSQSMGETPGEDWLPPEYPAYLGTRKIDDLLFRAGFFRLEDSGLTNSVQTLQMILPKNRLSLQGTAENWSKELRREFPEVADGFERLIEKLHKEPHLVSKAVDQVADLERVSPRFSNWFQSLVVESLGTEVSPEAAREWFKTHLSSWGRLYRPDARLKTSYPQYLVEHIRKWGVVVSDEPLEVKTQWTGFQLGGQRRARSLIINSLAGYRLATKHLKRKDPERFRSWLFYDRLTMPLRNLPEPLEENSLVSFAADDRHRIHVRRDLVRDEATVTIGTWLPFEDSKSWNASIEKGRQVLLRVVPFLDANLFRTIPTLLELTEMRGECVRRGHVNRLQLHRSAPKGTQRLLRWIRRSRLPQVGRQIYSVNPVHLPFNNRNASFKASLDLVEYFDRRRRGLTPKSLFCLSGFWVL